MSLCEAYWFPVYAYVRRTGKSTEDAQDLTQAFFARLIEKKDLRSFDPARGRFRTFLLASVRHFLANQHHAAVALKRGGGARHIPLKPRCNRSRAVDGDHVRETSMTASLSGISGAAGG